MSYSTIGYSLDRVQRPVGRGATSVHDVMCIDEAYPFYIYMYIWFIKREPVVPYLHTVLVVPIKYRLCFCTFPILCKYS